MRLPGDQSAEGRPVCWIVPKGTSVQRPAGFSFAGALMQHPLTEAFHTVSIRRNDWPTDVAGRTRALMLISSVQVRLSWSGGPDMPDSRHLEPRNPTSLAVDERTVVTAECKTGRWQGELLVVPMAVADEAEAQKTGLLLSVTRPSPTIGR